MPVTILVAIPFVSALVLALVGEGIYAPEVNIGASGLTCAAGIYLSMVFLSQGAMTEAHGFFHADALNVYLAAITAFVSLTTAIFSRKYMRTEKVGSIHSSNRGLLTSTLPFPYHPIEVSSGF